MAVVLPRSQKSLSTWSAYRHSVPKADTHPRGNNLAWNYLTLSERKQRSKQEAQQDGHHQAPEKEGRIGLGASGCDFFWSIDGEVIGQCSGCLTVSLKSPSSTCMGAPVLKDIAMHVCWVGTRLLPRTPPPLGYTSLVSVLPPFPYQQLFESEFQRTQERSGRPNEAYTLQGYREIEDTEGICIPKAHRVLLSFNSGNWVTMARATSCQNVARCCLNLKNRLWTVRFSELQVLDPSLIWLKPQSLGLPCWCDRPN